MKWKNVGEVKKGRWEGHELLLENGVTVYVTDEELAKLEAGMPLTSAIHRRHPVAKKVKKVKKVKKDKRRKNE